MATGDVILKYPASTALTCTLTTLASGAGRQALSVANSASGYTDGQMVIALKTTSGTHGASFVCYAHFYGGPSTTGPWPNPITTDTDAAVTITTGMNFLGPAVINFGTSATGLYTATCMIGSVAALFGGQLPMQFGVVIENQTNIALTNVGGDHSVTFYPTYMNVST